METLIEHCGLGGSLWTAARVSLLFLLGR